MNQKYLIKKQLFVYHYRSSYQELKQSLENNWSGSCKNQKITMNTQKTWEMYIEERNHTKSFSIQSFDAD